MDPRKQRTMDALVRAGQEIFSKRSVDDVTVEEIAERAGVAVGSIYNHFGSKAGLQAAVVAFPGQPGQYQAGQELSERLVRAVDEQNRRLVEALRQGIASGELRAVDPEEVATILWAAWNGVISLGWRPDSLRRDEAELRALLATATEVVANGLLVR